MTTICGRYKERRVNGLIWDRSPSGASTFQTEACILYCLLYIVSLGYWLS